jgi:vitamin B12 transporter
MRMVTMVATGGYSGDPMRRTGTGVILCMAVAVAHAHIHAQDAPLRELSPIVVSAMLPVTEATINQHVNVFTREQIEREAPASIAEFLSRRAGIVIDRSPRSGAYGSLFLRGADPSHVVILIDGIHQNDPLSSRGSAVDLNTLTLDDIKRIEVVRGSASVAHAEAMAGVVHLTTRSGNKVSTKAPSARAAMEGGGQGLAAASAAIAQGPWRASASLREGEEKDEGGSSRTRAANLGFNERWGRTRLQAQLRLADSLNFGFPDDSGGERYAVMRTLEERRSDTRQLSLIAEHEVDDAGDLELQISRMERDSFQDTPAVAPGLRDPFGLPPITSRGDYRRNEMQAA